MRIIVVLISILSLFFMANKCNTKHDIEKMILVSNRLDNAVYVIPNYDYISIIQSSQSRRMLLANSRHYVVGANSSNRMLISSLCYEEVWNYTVRTDTLVLYIYDKETLENKEWLHLDSILLKKYKITYNELISDSCTFVIE